MKKLLLFLPVLLLSLSVNAQSIKKGYKQLEKLAYEKAKEDGAAHDLNFDGDGDDGLTLKLSGVEGVLNGSAGDDFAW